MTKSSPTSPKTVAWLEPQLQHRGGALGWLNRLAGFAKCADEVRRRLVATLGAVQEVSDADGLEACDMAVVSAGQIGPDDLASLLADIGPRARPILWLIANEAQEQLVLQSIDAAQDACRLQDTPEVALGRLERLSALTTVRPLMALDNVDPLTGLLNRRGFGRVLRRALNDLIPGDQKAVVLLDLDGFKAINDTLGHAAGDELLRQVGQRLQASLRESDTAARLGGDEFAVVLATVTHAQDATGVARKIIEQIRQPFTLSEGPAQVSTSIGIAFYPDHATTARELAHHADLAMYAAKQAGKNDWRLWNSDLERNSPDS